MPLDRRSEKPTPGNPQPRGSRVSPAHHGVKTGRSRPELLFGLALISMIFIVQVAIVGTWTWLSEVRAQRLYENSLTSLEQVTRIARDIDQQRILADDHILESEPSGMAQVENQLSQVATDLHAALRAYGPLIALSNEEAIWRQAQVLMAHYEKVIDETLVLSRQNKDREARAKMSAVLSEYSELNQKITELMTIERGGANEAIARIRTLRRFDTIGMLATGIASLLILFAVGQHGVNRIASYEDQIVDYSRRLEGRNRELDAFAGRIAHDLKTPVASLTMAVDLVSRRAASEERPTFDRMRRSIKRISTMIDDLLAFARADAHPEGASNPAVVAAKIRDDFTERFGDAARLRETVEPASVAYNEGLLRQVLWNLVENGVKYRRDDVPADIGIVGRVVGGLYELQVSDNGLGMLPEEAGRAFEPFYRGQRVQDVSGTGLGLSIVKRIVEGGGGSVLVRTQLGRGTTFVLQLPLAGSQGKARDLSAEFRPVDAA